jgi:prophage regulatory protein
MANQSVNNTENSKTTPNDNLLRLKSVLQRIPVSKSTWWVWVKNGKAPQPVKLSAGVTAWRESDINRMVNNLGVV